VSGNPDGGVLFLLMKARLPDGQDQTSGKCGSRDALLIFSVNPLRVNRSPATGGIDIR